MEFSENLPLKPDSLNKKVTRRDFLKMSVAAASLMFPQPPKPESIEKNLKIISNIYQAIKPPRKPDLSPVKEMFTNLSPNEIPTMNNLSFIPNTDTFHHRDTERLSAVFNSSITYSKDVKAHPGHLDLGDSGIWIGIQDALKRHQKIYLVIEIPRETDASIEEWKNYVSTIAKNFPGATFIIGNELNIKDDYWGQRIDLYGNYYIAAAQEIKNASTDNNVLIYGDAWNGNGEVLRQVLDNIKGKVERSNASLKDIIDGIPFHFYDIASKLPDRAQLYQQIALKYGLTPKVHLTELGKGEIAFKDVSDIELKQKLQSQLLTQNLATALYLANHDVIDGVVWHTAYLINDPNEHSLTKINDKGTITGFKPAFDQFWKVSKLLHHDITVENMDGITVIKGKTSGNQDVLIAWNTDGPVEKKAWWKKLLEFDFTENSNIRTLNLDYPSVSNISLSRTTREDVEGIPTILVFDNANLVYRE